MTKNELIQFEEEIKDLFLEGKIRSPVHLSRGNEEQLIETFKYVKPDDWVFSTHRSHYHALLKGIPPDWLRNEILANRSIHINNAKHKFFTSAIVGGICPIAVGVAMGIKREKLKNHVWVFVGDMASETGIFHECFKYAGWHQLPLSFVIEDNNFSVSTPTKDVWGGETYCPQWHIFRTPGCVKYRYDRDFPHQGAGEWVQF